MKYFAYLLLTLALPSCLRAGEVAIYYLPQAQLQYEGSGFREQQAGWTFKVKPENPALGLRWRHEVSPKAAWQTQYLQNAPKFYPSVGSQTGQMRLALTQVMTDFRTPIANSNAEAIIGVQGAWASLEQKEIIFNGAPEAATPLERMRAAGGYIGVHAGRAHEHFFWDGEFTIGHYFTTHNSLKAAGGAITRYGYSYWFRAEAGYKSGAWRLGLAYLRGLVRIDVPGGKTLPGGATASMPINKFDFFSPAIAISYAY